MSQKREINEAESLFYTDLPQWYDEKAAFVKHDIYEGRPVWMVYDADGEKIAATDDREFAFIVARQNDLVPHSVH